MIDATLEGTEGKIYYHRWDPVGEPKRIVQFVHGYAEHGGRYAHAAEVLARDGAAVYADDHIGRGRSDGERAVIGTSTTLLQICTPSQELLSANTPASLLYWSGTPWVACSQGGMHRHGRVKSQESPSVVP
jgi:alpha-beta hydrolase superfamily lysophospholipase